MNFLAIPQDLERAKAAIAFHSKSAIVGMRLQHAVAQCRAASPSEPLEVEIRFRPELATESGDLVNIVSAFQFKATIPSESEPCLMIECRFEAAYQLRDRPLAEETSAFQEANAIFNCWPYFREFVQSTAARMGFNPPTVPFLRLVPAAKPSPASQPARTGQARKRTKPSRDKAR